MKSLKKCPFCGSIAQQIRQSYPDGTVYYLVGCWAQWCEIKPTVIRENELKARNAWNKRPTKNKIPKYETSFEGTKCFVKFKVKPHQSCKNFVTNIIQKEEFSNYDMINSERFLDDTVVIRMQEREDK